MAAAGGLRAAGGRVLPGPAAAAGPRHHAARSAHAGDSTVGMYSPIMSSLYTLGSVRRPRTMVAILFTRPRSEEHTSELQSLMRISYAVFCLKKKTYTTTT